MHNNDAKSNKSIVEISKDSWEALWETTKPLDADNIILNHFIFDAYLDEATTFAAEKNLKFEPEPYLIERNKIRKLLMHGLVDDAMSEMNEINPEILDKDLILYYNLIEHKASEMIVLANQKGFEDYLDDILEFVNTNLVPLVEQCEDLNKSFERFLSYLVFSDDDIQKKRREVFMLANHAIMKNYDIKNELKNILRGVLEGEDRLSDKYKFPVLQSYFEPKT